MVAYNFKKEFAPDIQSGKKAMTIRTRRRAMPGDTLQFYTGLRTKGCEKLGEAVAILVDSVSLTPDGPFFGSPWLWPKDRDDFARLDGFDSYADMYRWFSQTYQYSPEFYGEDFDYDDDTFIFTGWATVWSQFKTPGKEPGK